MEVTRTFSKLAAAMARNPRYIDNEGGTRSGKTYSVLQMLVLVVPRDKAGEVTSVVSETMPHLKRGCIREFRKIMEDEGVWEDSRWSVTDKTYTFASGSVLEFFSADNPGKVHGPARKRLFMNEGQNVSYDIARQLFVRTTHMIIVDYNPTHVFWMHENIKPRENCISIHSTYKDNTFLTPEQVMEIESNKGDRNWWRVYGEGKTGMLEGLIYDFEQIDEMPPKGADKPEHINSGYRCPELNAAVGGVPTSQHVKGEAADIACSEPHKLAQLACDLGLPFDQLILYPTFVHFSHRLDGNQRKKVLYSKTY